MPIQSINNVQFNYELLGTKSALPPIVFIAGYTCDINFWRPVAEYFSVERQVLIFDNQGIGKTKDNGKPLSVAEMAANIKALIQQLGLDKAIVVGFALGGTITLQIAHDFPEHCRKIILLSAAMKLSAEAALIYEELCKLRESGKLDVYSDLIYETCFGADYKVKMDKKTFRENFVPMLEKSQSAADQRRQIDAFKAFDASGWAKEIKVPAVIINPREDQFATPTEGEALAKAINSGGTEAKNLVIEDSSHSILIEQLEMVKAIFKEQCG